MDKLISQQAALNLFPEDNLYWDTNDGYLAPHYVRRLLMTLTSTEPEAISKWKKEFREYVDSLDIARDDWKGIVEYIDELPSAQPFHNITMTDVLKYIDDMPEDVWQEFTACLECRGWELQRRTAKWCGGDFA